jgi:hypothetical protein
VDGVNGRVSGILADSVALWVKQDGNAGPGSLRNAALCANAGDTLKFKSTLFGDTIHITSGPVIFNSNARIVQSNGQSVLFPGSKHFCVYHWYWSGYHLYQYWNI